MFSKKSKIDRTTGLTVIEGGRARGPRGISMLAEGCAFDGRMFLQGESRIGGTIEGVVISDGHLTIEESAHIKGEITGVSLHLNGTVEGRLKVSDILHVSATGRIRGELHARRLVVDDGARIEGRVSYVDGGEEAGSATTLGSGSGASAQASAAIPTPVPNGGTDSGKDQAQGNGRTTHKAAG